MVVLLGAGASKDAGLPVAEKLTPRLYAAAISGVGASRPVVQEFIEFVLSVLPEARTNYELLFAEALGVVRGLPGCLAVPEHLRDVPRLFYGHAAGWLAQILTEAELKDYSYLSRVASLTDVNPAHVFSLNFDRLVERACQDAGTPLVTGFDADGRWKPDLFEATSQGVLLHKLHGSISWYERPRGGPTEVIEVLGEAESSPSLRRTPSLVLGPVKRPTHIETPSEEVFDLLFERFREAIDWASVCITIGFGWRDEHVLDVLVPAYDHGLGIVEVGPTDTGRSHFGRGARYVHVPYGAKEALESGLVVEAIRSLLR